MHREREQVAARDRHLNMLAKRQTDAWRRIDALVVTKRPGDYDAAITLLQDLCEVAERKDRTAAFAARVDALREVHAKKPSLLARLKKAGF